MKVNRRVGLILMNERTDQVQNRLWQQNFVAILRNICAIGKRKRKALQSKRS